MSEYYSDSEAKRLIIDIGKRMYDRRYVSANDGNISIKVGEDRFWVTPAGVSKGYMDEDMLVCIDSKGNVLEGSSKPSSETAMHLRVYRENESIKCVVHAHPIAATSFAVARIPLDIAIMTESVLGLGVVPVAEYATTGTPAVAESVAPYCRDYNALLLANHGALTWGEGALQAYYRMESLECYAQIMMNLGYLNKPACLLTKTQVDELIEKREKHGVKTGGVPVSSEEISE
ncbi:MAG: class II aldolase/adducin family protein [Oscillospiraceae bacterium]|nr:class II aldolase/adducin family protein [Oscillospiraceae bacterium]